MWKVVLLFAFLTSCSHTGLFLDSCRTCILHTERGRVEWPYHLFTRIHRLIFHVVFHSWTNQLGNQITRFMKRFNSEDMRVSNWWWNFYFWVNYPFQEEIKTRRCVWICSFISWPGLKSVTPGPTLSTTPAPSCPRTVGKPRLSFPSNRW